MSSEDSMETARGNSLMSEENSMPELVPAEKEPLRKTELAKEQRRLWLLQREGVILKDAIAKNKYSLQQCGRKDWSKKKRNDWKPQTCMIFWLRGVHPKDMTRTPSSYRTFDEK